MQRVLGVVRLSRSTEESTSVERQGEAIRKWVDLHGGELADVARDVDVSGAVSPFERDGLGPWLTDTPPAQWDTLVAWRLDRISRNARDALELLEWCQKRGKRIVTISDGIDSGSGAGKLYLQITAALAEAERDAIRSRVADSRRKLRESGRYPGGAVRYGYKQGPDGQLVPDPEVKPIIDQMIAWYLSGDSVQQIVNRLNEQGVPSPRDRQRQLRGAPMKGDQWHENSTWQMLTSGQLRGYMLHQGEPVVVNGEIVQIAEPIITVEQHRAIQAEARRRSRPHKVKRVDAAPLFGIVRCLECGEDLYSRRQRYTGYAVRYYYCRAKHTGQIREDTLAAFLADSFLADFGGKRVREKVLIPAEDHSRELESAVETLEALTRSLGAVRSATVRDNLLQQIATLDARIAELEKLPRTETRYEWRELAYTYGELWDSAKDDAERWELLRRSGVALHVMKPKGSNRLEVHLYQPMEQYDELAG